MHIPKFYLECISIETQEFDQQEEILDHIASALFYKCNLDVVLEKYTEITKAFDNTLQNIVLSNF